MELWVAGGVMVGIGLLFVAFGYWGREWETARKRRRRDERRHAEQLEWRRRLQAGEGIPVRYETVYRPEEMVDEDAARMAELGYYIADEVFYGDGSRRIVYRLEGVSAL